MDRRLPLSSCAIVNSTGGFVPFKAMEANTAVGILAAIHDPGGAVVGVLNSSVGLNEWGTDPADALGRTVFTVALFAAPGGAAIKGTSAAAKIAEVEAAGTRGATSLLSPGPFAAASIPARGTSQTFLAAERKAINTIGNEFGCHSCGNLDPGTKSGNFVPDHQPASALLPAGESQSLYPQCLSCSTRQGLDIMALLRRGQ